MRRQLAKNAAAFQPGACFRASLPPVKAGQSPRKTPATVQAAAVVRAVLAVRTVINHYEKLPEQARKWFEQHDSLLTHH